MFLKCYGTSPSSIAELAAEWTGRHVVINSKNTEPLIRAFEELLVRENITWFDRKPFTYGTKFENDEDESVTFTDMESIVGDINIYV